MAPMRLRPQPAQAPGMSRYFKSMESTGLSLPVILIAGGRKADGGAKSV